MRRVLRLRLGEDALAWLQDQTDSASAASDPRREAMRLWSQASQRQAIREIRATLRRMANGRDRCMYCEDSLGTDIDHFWPKSVYSCLTFIWENHVLACSHCNVRKEDAFPLDEDGRPLLINPTEEDPAEHFDVSYTEGRLTPVTRKGAETHRVLSLDRTVLVDGRRDAFRVLQELLANYGRARAAGEVTRADEIRIVISRINFAGTFDVILRLARQAPRHLLAGCVETLAKFPEIASWLDQAPLLEREE